MSAPSQTKRHRCIVKILFSYLSNNKKKTATSVSLHAYHRSACKLNPFTYLAFQACPPLLPSPHTPKLLNPPTIQPHSVSMFTRKRTNAGCNLVKRRRRKKEEGKKEKRCLIFISSEGFWLSMLKHFDRHSPHRRCLLSIR